MTAMRTRSDRTAPAGGTTPVTWRVLLDPTPGRRILTTTDLIPGPVTSVVPEAARSGRALLPAMLLGNYAANLPSRPGV